MIGVRTVSASFHLDPKVTQRDWSNRVPGGGITCTGQDSISMFLIQLLGSNRFRGNGHQPLRV
jgi:hypothetical protein